MDEDKIEIEAEHRAIAYACRSGWVLLIEGREVRARTEYVISYYLYNGITGKVTELPNLTLQTHPIDLSTFSSNPTSTDCVIFRVIVFCRRSNLYQHIHNKGTIRERERRPEGRRQLEFFFT